MGVLPLASMGAELAPVREQLPSFFSGRINQCSPNTSRPTDWCCSNTAKGWTGDGKTAQFIVDSKHTSKVSFLLEVFYMQMQKTKKTWMDVKTQTH